MKVRVRVRVRCGHVGEDLLPRGPHGGDIGEIYGRYRGGSSPASWWARLRLRVRVRVRGKG